MKKYIYGGHLAEYMEEMMEEEPEKYEKHFARFLEEGVQGEDLEELYTAVGSAGHPSEQFYPWVPLGRHACAWLLGTPACAFSQLA